MSSSTVSLYCWFQDLNFAVKQLEQGVVVEYRLPRQESQGPLRRLQPAGAIPIVKRFPAEVARLKTWSAAAYQDLSVGDRPRPAQCINPLSTQGNNSRTLRSPNLQDPKFPTFDAIMIAMRQNLLQVLAAEKINPSLSAQVFQSFSQLLAEILPKIK